MESPPDVLEVACPEPEWEPAGAPVGAFGHSAKATSTMPAAATPLDAANNPGFDRKRARNPLAGLVPRPSTSDVSFRCSIIPLDSPSITEAPPESISASRHPLRNTRPLFVHLLLLPVAVWTPPRPDGRLDESPADAKAARFQAVGHTLGFPNFQVVVNSTEVSRRLSL